MHMSEHMSNDHVQACNTVMGARRAPTQHAHLMYTDHTPAHFLILLVGDALAR